MPEMTIQDPLAAAARQAVEARGISARKLAKRLGMKPRTVLDFLNGRRETRHSTKISICRELGINQESIPMPPQEAPTHEPTVPAHAEAPSQQEVTV